MEAQPLESMQSTVSLGSSEDVNLPIAPLYSDCDPSPSNLAKSDLEATDPLVLPEPPKEGLQSDCGATDPSFLPEPPEEPLQSDCGATDPSFLPEPPEEPLQSDCCGTGCSPCVFDIYEEDLKRWRELVALTPEERLTRMQKQRHGGSEEKAEEAKVALSPLEYRVFEVTGIQQVSRDSYLFTFGLPEEHVLGTGIGQHIVLRYLL